MTRRITTIAVALLLAVPVANVAAQETLQVNTASQLRDTLGRAEAMLASNNAEGAWELLQALDAEVAGDAYFDYLLGVAALDSGRATLAILSLQRAAAAAPQYSAARMELARAHFEAGERDQARPIFVALLAESPPPGVGKIIDQYIAAIDAKPATPASDFSPYAELMVGYDDNANGSTSDQQFLGFTLEHLRYRDTCPV